MKKNTRVKIAGVPEDNYASCYNGMVGITLNESKSPCLRIAINGVLENQHTFTEQYLTPVEPSISTLCVGDVLIDRDGDETRVLAMQGDSFLRSHVGNLDHAGDWYTKDQASLFGWEVKEENLIRWKKWDTGETGTWDDGEEEIAYVGSGWTYPPHPFETGTKEPGETGTKPLEFDDIKSWHKSYTNEAESEEESIAIKNSWTGDIIFQSTKTTWKEAVEEAVENGANFYGANLREANLYKANLSGADLREANLYKANLRYANLHEANLSVADLREADLRRADLSGANFYGANLCEADLHEANLHGANLYKAGIYEVNLRGANLRDANLYGAELMNAKFYGKGGTSK